MRSWWENLDSNAKPSAALLLLMGSLFFAMAVYSSLFTHWHRCDFFFLSFAFFNFANGIVATWPLRSLWSRLSSGPQLARFCIGASFGCFLCFLLQLPWAAQGP
jgi:hypothetical protein